jgi:hypothetical protein
MNGGSTPFSTDTYDFSHFSSSIGSWAPLVNNALTLTFNTSTYNNSSVSPNFTGIINWWNGTNWWGQIVGNTLITAGANIQLKWSGSAWVLTINSGNGYTTSTNNGQYGFILRMTLFN